MQAQQGFAYEAEKPLLPSWVEQKWGWRATEPGEAAGAPARACWRLQAPALLSPACLHMTWRFGANLCHPLPTGAWAELEVDSRLNLNDTAGAPAPAPSGNSSADLPLVPRYTEIELAHLTSYAGMGTAAVECVAGCACEPSVLDGTTARRVSVFRVHSFKARTPPVAGLCT